MEYKEESSLKVKRRVNLTTPRRDIPASLSSTQEREESHKQRLRKEEEEGGKRERKRERKRKNHVALH